MQTHLRQIYFLKSPFSGTRGTCKGSGTYTCSPQPLQAGLSPSQHYSHSIITTRPRLIPRASSCPAPAINPRNRRHPVGDSGSGRERRGHTPIKDQWQGLAASQRPPLVKGTRLLRRPGSEGGEARVFGLTDDLVLVDLCMRENLDISV